MLNFGYLHSGGCVGSLEVKNPCVRNEESLGALVNGFGLAAVIVQSITSLAWPAAMEAFSEAAQ